MLAGRCLRVLTGRRLSSTAVSSMAKEDPLASFIDSITKEKHAHPSPPAMQATLLRSTESIEKIEKSLSYGGVPRMEALAYIASKSHSSFELHEQNLLASLSSSGGELNASTVCDALLCLIRANYCDSELFRSAAFLLEKCDEDEFNAVNLPALYDILIRTASLPTMAPSSESTKRKLQKILIERITSTLRHADKVADILHVLHHHEPDKITECQAALTSAILRLLPVTSLSERVNILAALPRVAPRDFALVNTVSVAIASNANGLSIRQCCKIATAARTLRLRESRLQRKVAEDVRRTVNTLVSWQDARNLMTILSWWRLRDERVCQALANWTEARAKNAPFKELAAVVNEMAKIGTEAGKGTAKVLLGRVRREGASAAPLWLGMLHSLAFFDCLSHELVESALSESFLDELLKSQEKSPVVVHNLLKLLQIRAYARYKLKIPSSLDVSKILARVTLDDVLIDRFATHQKSLKSREAFRSCLARVTGKEATSARLHPSGAFVEAEIPPGRGSSLTPKGSPNQPIAVLFSADRHLAFDEEGLESPVGAEQLAARLLEAEGYKVATFTASKMTTFASEVEATAYVKSQIYG